MRLRPPSARLPLAAAALASVALLAGCFPLPPADEVVTVSLQTADGLPVELAATIPGGSTDAGPVAVSGCVDDAQSWDLATPDGIVSFATTSAATACPDASPVNGGFPSWASAAQLPEGAAPITVAGVPAHRFDLDYTECTNFCTTWPRELALLELDGATVLIAATGPTPARFDAMLASIVLQG